MIISSAKTGPEGQTLVNLGAKNLAALRALVLPEGPLPCRGLANSMARAEIPNRKNVFQGIEFWIGHFNREPHRQGNQVPPKANLLGTFF